MTKVNPLVEYGIRKPLVALSKAPGMDIVRRNFRNKNMAFINGLAITSIIAKDGLGCYMYVNQSLHNDKIPDDKRKFVAALDLANGGLMILMQILMHMTISNKLVQTKMFNKLFGKNFDRAALKTYKKILNKREKFSNVDGKEFHKAMDNIKDSVNEAFSSLTSLVAATIIGKRVIVPFIATPLADKTKAWMCRNDKPVTVDKETVNTYDKDNAPAEKHKKDDVNNKQSSNLLTSIKNKFSHNN